MQQLEANLAEANAAAQRAKESERELNARVAEVEAKIANFEKNREKMAKEAEKQVPLSKMAFSSCWRAVMTDDAADEQHEGEGGRSAEEGARGTGGSAARGAGARGAAQGDRLPRGADRRRRRVHW